MKYIFYILGLTTLIASCNTKNLSTEIGKEIKTPNINYKYGVDSASCIKNLSIYREYYKLWKQSKYKNDMLLYAYTPWYDAYRLCPKSTENLYVDGVRIMNYFIEKEPDTYRRSQYIDTLMLLFDKRIEYFPGSSKRPMTGQILARKGVSLYKLDSTRFADVYYILRQSINLEKEKSKKATFYFYLITLQKMYENHLLSIEEARFEFDMIFNYFDNKLNYYRRISNKRKVEELTNYNTKLLEIYENTFNND